MSWWDSTGFHLTTQNGVQFKTYGFPWWLSGLRVWIKELIWYKFILWPGKFPMPWVWQKQKKTNKQTKKNLFVYLWHFLYSFFFYF